MPGHAIITGGSSGIGLAIARLYAARGAKISLIARTIATLGVTHPRMKCDDTIQALQIQAVSREIVHSVWKDHLCQGRVFADSPGNATRLSSGQQRRYCLIIVEILSPPWARGGPPLRDG